jgi:hypothetical protein
MDAPICDAFDVPENGATIGDMFIDRLCRRSFARSAARGASRALEIHSQIPAPTAAMPTARCGHCGPDAQGSVKANVQLSIT